MVLFAHGSGSSRHSPCYTYVAQILQRGGFGTLLLSLETPAQAGVYVNTLQETHLWLNEVMEELYWKDEHKAYLALKATLHTLRDWLTVDEAAHLGA